MKVVAYSGEGRAHVEERETPEPGRGELLLRLGACGLCGTDLFKLANDTIAAGEVLGHEIVGVVERIGEGVDWFTLGDRVVVPHHVPCGECEFCRRGSETMCATFRENLMSPGGFSELVLVRERAVAQAARKIPASVSDEVAVFVEPAACVLRGIERSGIEEGGTALVIGGGSMGLLHVVVLLAEDPSARVLLVEPIAERRELALELGAAFACDPESTGAIVREATEGRGVDAVFDTVGGARLLASAIEQSRPGGSVVLFAHAKSGERADFDINVLFKSERRIVATYSGALREQDRIWELTLAGRFDPSALVTHRFSFEDFDEAVAAVRERRGLKVLLSPEVDS